MITRKKNIKQKSDFSNKLNNFHSNYHLVNNNINSYSSEPMIIDYDNELQSEPMIIDNNYNYNYDYELQNEPMIIDYNYKKLNKNIINLYIIRLLYSDYYTQ